ncbi:hypothetical protein [Treponema sp. R6D11]
MSENTQIQNEEEISLLDLFTVILRYRKLIIIVTLAAVVIAVAGYFVYPLYQVSEAKKGIKTQGIMKVEVAQKAQSYMSQTLESFILSPDNIYNSLYKAGMKNFSYSGGSIPLNDKNRATIMYLINLFWIQNMDLNGEEYAKKDVNKIFNVKRTGQVVEVTLKETDAKVIKNFMENIYDLSKTGVEENMRGNAKLMVNNYERLLNLPKKSESVQMMLERDFDTFVFLSDFLDGKEAVVKLAGEPVLAETPVSLILFQNQYPRKGIMIGFAGLFLSIALAFLLNVIRNVKQDKEAMKKINEAMGNSGDK